MYTTLYTALISDLEITSSIQFEAILPTTRIEQLIYPSGMTTDALIVSIEDKELRFHPPHVRYIKAVTEDGKILSFERWYTWDHDKAFDAWWATFAFNPPEELSSQDMNVDATKAFYEGIDKLKKRKVRDKASTHPNYQSSGAGSQHVKWGKEYAIEQRFDIYAVSTPESLSWYEKFGFRSIDDFSIDMTLMGGTREDGTLGIYTATLMKLTVSK
ncbi:uncharacterized protein FFUJ_12115 [Fusarium fujikuroi IMI 58289]|uniref:N-acetyltransferase domain-containing protein n=1 Tax=Gibberella fujikuroi (strain CBS 195.34 / IMI 58289 / NRRL A-6831) TaxID=1279085 RepID=S0EC97_GIBF5|nr:uncharacterized protein FFUJ_12115 [Fusarium fujikuroi IMI 58289]KLP05205.1 uncharacterized protein LW94_7713 [Fusarium fujikuroi]CCT72265.1 uncharacterized protein FFUJ_12115 [Fusarium fujikuroi IMI 58289]SCO18866.1 uncharacterized protein FFM5_11974 [Fusarium fujikuroi]SCO55163.1 uncharacterized protein FFMR_12319 [Fusarium fujikuroi]SCV37380.1 uncharacterized protein FFB14_06581 [Fusarium fujikuroi]